MRSYAFVGFMFGLIAFCFLGPLLFIVGSMLHDKYPAQWVEFLRKGPSLSDWGTLLMSWLRWFGEFGWTALLLFVAFLALNFWWFLCRVVYVEADLVPKAVKPEKGPIPNPDELTREGD